ncbi:MAG: hypothetical protein ACI9UA_004526 [Pseudoalteromonas tetraodonis]|jgi:hypothetical protein
MPAQLFTNLFPNKPLGACGFAIPLGGLRSLLGNTSRHCQPHGWRRGGRIWAQILEGIHPPEDGIDFDAEYHDGKFAD